MTSFGCFTPICYEKKETFSQYLHEAAEEYLHLGGSKRAYVIPGNINANILEVELREGATLGIKNLILGAIKIISFVTVLLPAIALGIKLFFRATHQFTVKPIKEKFSEMPQELFTKILEYNPGSCGKTLRLSKEIYDKIDVENIFKRHLKTDYGLSSIPKELIEQFTDKQGKINFSKILSEIKTGYRYPTIDRFPKSLIRALGGVTKFAEFPIKNSEQPRDYMVMSSKEIGESPAITKGVDEHKRALIGIRFKTTKDFTRAIGGRNVVYPKGASFGFYIFERYSPGSERNHITCEANFCPLPAFRATASAGIFTDNEKDAHCIEPIQKLVNGTLEGFALQTPESETIVKQ